MRLRYYTVDAFTDRAFEGAQIAVVPDAQGLSDTQMQTIAREFNLSETVFVLPPNNAAHIKRLRMFTPFKEIPFGGHPTLAATHVLMTIGDISVDDPRVKSNDDAVEFVFEQPVGPVNVCVRGPQDHRFCEFGLHTEYSIDRYTLQDRELARIFSLNEADLGMDGFPFMVVVADQPYLIAPIRSFAAVRRAKFDYGAWAHSSAPATISHQALLFTNETEFETSGYHCRLVGPEIGVNEDLPIGSSIPAFVGYLCEVAGSRHMFTAERGAGKFRRSLLHVKAEKRGAKSVDVRVGGTAVMVCDGHLQI